MTVRHSLRNGEYPDNAALRHVLLPPDQLTHEPLLEGGVDTPARLYRDVLDAIDLEGRGWRDDTGVGAELPKLLAGLSIVGAELAVVGAAPENEAAGGRKQ